MMNGYPIKVSARHLEPSSEGITTARQCPYLKVVVVHGKVLLDNPPLGLGPSRGGGEQVLWVPLVVHPLKARGAQGGEEEGHDDKVPGVVANANTEPEEQPLERVVHHSEGEPAPPCRALPSCLYKLFPPTLALPSPIVRAVCVLVGRRLSV